MTASEAAGNRRPARRTTYCSVLLLIALTGCSERTPPASVESSASAEFELAAAALPLLQSAPGSHWSGDWQQVPNSMGQRLRITHLGDGQHTFEILGTHESPLTLAGNPQRISSKWRNHRQRADLQIQSPEHRCALFRQQVTETLAVESSLCRM